MKIWEGAISCSSYSSATAQQQSADVTMRPPLQTPASVSSQIQAISQASEDKDVIDHAA